METICSYLSENMKSATIVTFFRKGRRWFYINFAPVFVPKQSCAALWGYLSHWSQPEVLVCARRGYAS